MTQTRRLAAILAADVAGYSRLMGVDEEGTHARLQAHLREVVNPKIQEHRGRVVKNTGDGMLAEFPSVVDAVRDKLDYAFEDLGQQQVKNITRPLRVYRVRDLSTTGKSPSASASPALSLPDKPSIAVSLTLQAVPLLDLFAQLPLEGSDRLDASPSVATVPPKTTIRVGTTPMALNSRNCRSFSRPNSSPDGKIQISANKPPRARSAGRGIQPAP